MEANQASVSSYTHQVLTEALASRILFDDKTSGDDVVANGVEFIHGGKTYTVKVNKEVVVSAG